MRDGQRKNQESAIPGWLERLLISFQPLIFGFQVRHPSENEIQS